MSDRQDPAAANSSGPEAYEGSRVKAGPGPIRKDGLDSGPDSRVVKLRFHVGTWIAYRLWFTAEALTAVGNWAEDVATAKHPLSFKTHWSQRGDAPKGGATVSAEQRAAFACRFPGCNAERLPKMLWCEEHRLPAVRDDGRCLATSCGYEAVDGSPWCSSHLRRHEQSQELDALRLTLSRAVFVTEHLLEMIDPQTWRDSGGDDGQGHFEGDYRAEQTAAEIERWKAEVAL